MTLSGHTQLTGIFGYPVKHSLSPAMHNAAYRTLGMDRSYVPFQVKPGDLRTALRAIPALEIVGVNLTVPHKERGARIVDKLSAEAKTLGAINCVVNRRGTLFGDNTDARGLERDLRERGIALQGRRAVIVGAGGGAAAALVSCIRLGARSIAITNRTRRRALRLASRFAGRTRGKIETFGLDALTGAAVLDGAALVINATSIGLGAEAFPRIEHAATANDCLFYDLLYAAKPTNFLVAAAAAGRSTSDGAGMLLWQGVLAFELFNGTQAPAGVMREVLFERLGRAID